MVSCLWLEVWQMLKVEVLPLILNFICTLKKKYVVLHIVISVHNKESADKLCLKAGDKVA